MRSVGATSDEFLKVMDSKYQANLHPRSMGAATRFSAISLEGNPQLLEKGPVKLKLFFESDKEDRRAGYISISTGHDLDCI